MEFTAEKSDRLDKFLAEHLAKFSRTQFQRFIKDGAITVNDKPVKKPGLRLKMGDKIVIIKGKILGQGKEFNIEPESDIPLNIVYEDKDILAINKPAGLLVHPTASQHRHTLVNALLAKYPKIAGVGDPISSSTEQAGQVNLLRSGIVHRLDKDTSGLMVIAKNQKAFLFLKDQFLNRKIIKKYLALVEGIPKDKEGVINFQIRPSTQNRLKKVAIKKLDTSGKKSVRSAETYYKIKKIINDNLALLEVTPKTGRTHQIRVHLAAIGHPVVGDSLYGSKSNLAKRQMLHAYSLKFIAPSGKKLALEIGLPKDFQKYDKKGK